MSPKRREVNQPFYEAQLKLFKCRFSNCQVRSKRKLNLKKHLKNCESQKQRKVNKNTYPYCKGTFSQKYNRDTHIKNVYQKYYRVYVGNDEKVIKAPEEAIKKQLKKEPPSKCHLGRLKRYQMLYLQVRQGKVSMLVCQQFTKKLLLAKFWRLLEQKILNLEELQQQIHNTILTEQSESVDCLSERIIKEIEQKKRRTIKGYEEEFQTLIIKKIKQDLRKHDKREFALVLLIETFGDFIHDHKFIP